MPDERFSSEMSGLVALECGRPLTLVKSILDVNIDGFVSTILARLTYFNQFEHEVNAMFIYKDDKTTRNNEERSYITTFFAKTRDQNIRLATEAATTSHTTSDYALQLETEHTCVFSNTDSFQIKLGRLGAGEEICLDLTVVGKLENTGEALRFQTTSLFTPLLLQSNFSNDNLVWIKEKEADFMMNDGAASQPQQGLSYDDVIRPCATYARQPYLFEITIRACMPCLLAGCFSPSHAIQVDADANATNAETVLISLVESYNYLKEIQILFYPSHPLDSYVTIELGECSSTKEPDFLNDAIIAVSFMPDLPKHAVYGEFVFMVDRSGSMNGSHICNARESLIIFLKSLPTTVLFNVISFGSYSRALFPSSRAYNQENLEKACSYANTIRADMGGSELLKPLQTVMEQPLATGRTRNIFLLTDGDITNTEIILEYLRSCCTKTRVFTFGIGPKIFYNIVSSIASVGRGKAYFVGPRTNIQTKVVQCLKETLQPVLCNIKVDWELPESLHMRYSSQDIHLAPHGQRLNLYASVTLPSKRRYSWRESHFEHGAAVKEFWFDEDFDSCQLGDNLFLEDLMMDDIEEDFMEDWYPGGDIRSQCSDYEQLTGDKECGSSYEDDLNQIPQQRHGGTSGRREESSSEVDQCGFQVIRDSDGDKNTDSGDTTDDQSSDGDSDRHMTHHGHSNRMVTDGDFDRMMIGCGDSERLVTGYDHSNRIATGGDSERVVTGDGVFDRVITGDGVFDRVITGDGVFDRMITGDGDSDMTAGSKFDKVVTERGDFDQDLNNSFQNADETPPWYPNHHPSSIKETTSTIDQPDEHGNHNFSKPHSESLIIEQKENLISNNFAPIFSTTYDKIDQTTHSLNTRKLTPHNLALADQNTTDNQQTTTVETSTDKNHVTISSFTSVTTITDNTSGSLSGTITTSDIINDSLSANKPTEHNNELDIHPKNTSNSSNSIIVDNIPSDTSSTVTDNNCTILTECTNHHAGNHGNSSNGSGNHDNSSVSNGNTVEIINEKVYFHRKSKQISPSKVKTGNIQEKDSSISDGKRRKSKKEMSFYETLRQNYFIPFWKNPFSRNSQPSLTDLYEEPESENLSTKQKILSENQKGEMRKSGCNSQRRNSDSCRSKPSPKRSYPECDHMTNAFSSCEWGSVNVTGFLGPEVFRKRVPFCLKTTSSTADCVDLHRMAAVVFIRNLETSLGNGVENDDVIVREIIELSKLANMPSQFTTRIAMDNEGDIVSSAREFECVLREHQPFPPVTSRKSPVRGRSDDQPPAILVSSPSVDEVTSCLVRSQRAMTEPDHSSDEECKYYRLERVAPEGCDQVKPTSESVDDRRKIVEPRHQSLKTVQRRRLVSARLTLLTKKMKNAQKLNIFAGPPFVRFVLLQSADGFWELTFAFARILGLPLVQLELAAPFADCTMIPLGDQEDQLGVDGYYDALALWATAIGLVYLQKRWRSYEKEWELVASKANAWLQSQALPQGFSYNDVMLAARQAIVLLEQKYRSRAKSEPVGLV